MHLITLGITNVDGISAMFLLEKCLVKVEEGGKDIVTTTPGG